MKHEEIKAITLMMLHIWMDQCHCDWYEKTGGKCSRCYSLNSAEDALPLIFHAFTNTIKTMETTK
jgi:hypothetical protein